MAALKCPRDGMGTCLGLGVQGCSSRKGPAWSTSRTGASGWTGGRAPSTVPPSKASRRSGLYDAHRWAGGAISIGTAGVD